MTEGSTANNSPSGLETHAGGSDFESIASLLEHAAHLLPAQGPIAVFVHHNTLHAFQHLPFEKAVVEAAAVFGAEPYMSEEAFHREMARGRIRTQDLEAVLAAEPDLPILKGRLTRRLLRAAILQERTLEPAGATLVWDLEEGRLVGLRKSGLIAACAAKLAQLGDPVDAAPSLPGTVQARLMSSLHDRIHPLLIRLTGAYVDQGISYWPMPGRQRGFYTSVRELFCGQGLVDAPAMRGLDREFARQLRANFTAEQALEDALKELGIRGSARLPFIERELLALPGWAGMFHRLEQESELAQHVQVPMSLVEFLAVRMTLLRVAAIRSDVLDDAVASPAGEPFCSESDLAIARFAWAARALGIAAQEIAAMSLESAAALWREIVSFSSLERRRVLHLAYELRHEKQVLLPLAAYRNEVAIRKRPPRPAAQVFFCIDDREESTRRHLEEVDPEIETLGAAGFFGVAMNFTGIDDGFSAALCPVVVKPQHIVQERPVEEHHEIHNRRALTRRIISRWLRTHSLATRELLSGWVATAVLGIFSVFPLLLRVLSPRTYARLRDRVNETLVPRPETELAFTRESEEMVQGLAQGFTIQEKADRVGAVLAGAGLTENFARLIVVLGHGATSLNNPHESAYNCGACGGLRGGPNGRLFAAMANHPEVRTLLAERGMPIPEDTWFVGGYHDTSSDQIDLFDLKRLPDTHIPDLERVRRSLDITRERNAHERARRFESARLTVTPSEALRHVQGRAEHIAEPRTECGHATNAICVVGRREITRGLFLDRRAFLVSYDAARDPEDIYLARQLAAVVPVCAGINLEYYFSYVDNEVYGCGTKLPHNVTGLIGVMNGYASDLRTGLPWQMVEIHEPVRLLLVVETTPERLNKVVQANPQVKEFVENRWLRLATIDHRTGEIHVYRDGSYQLMETGYLDLPLARNSQEWYSGRREHLPIARIASAVEAA